ncbi:MAG: flagellar hook-associated protein FlgK [Pseudomonas balearica]|nr:flagellar hook-associated protein FlgK [Stutzerimonas balearica]
MADLLNIGLSGLSASKTQLSITGHNVTNVNTPGYTRQDATQATRTPQFSGAGYIGSGTSLVEVRRSYSEFLTAQLRNSTSLSGDVEAYKSQIDQLDSLLAGTTTGITPSLNSFFSALQTAAEDPANIPARQLVLAESEGLARRFNTVYDRLYQQNDSLNKQMQTVTDQVNRLAGSIGSLNDAIAVAAANGKQPNDLLDQRDEAVRQLSQYVGVTVVPQDDSSFNIFVGSGQPLVVGATVNRLEVRPGSSDPTRAQVDFVSGSSRQTVTTMLSGGELGGLIRYREEVLDPTLNSLGRLALSVADEMNAQLGQGLDLKGNVGVDLFKDINSPDLVDKRSYPTGVNVNITDTSQLGTKDYEIEIVSLDGAGGGTYRIREAGGAWSNGAFGDDKFGFSLDLAGGNTLGVGDRVQIMPTRRGAAGISVELDQADQLAFASPARAEADIQNAGTGSITQPSLISAPSPIDRDALKAAFTALPALQANVAADGSYTLDPAALPAGWSYVDQAGNPTTPNLQSGSGNTLRLAYTTAGETYQFEFSMNGRPQTGDKFALTFNQSGVSDNRNALALVDLQNKQVLGVTVAADGSVSGASFTDGYGELVERVGTLTAQSRLDSEATGAILKQATDNRDSLSAVNLDEEAANLIKFEQYYNASAQIIQVARSLFDTLISTFR